jgi:hypothetical protein
MGADPGQGPWRWALGVWLIGPVLNYLPLAVYAVMLGGAGALHAELAGVDAGTELRRYGVRQLSGSPLARRDKADGADRQATSRNSKHYDRHLPSPRA